MSRIHINFEKWKQLYALEVWQVAAMMGGYDPISLSMGEILVHDPDSDYGQAPDISWDERRLITAIQAGFLKNLNANESVPSRKSSISLSDLIPWLEQEGFHELASDLKKPNQNNYSETDSEPERRLQALEALGGKATKKFIKGEKKWSFKKISVLTNQENKQGRSRTDPKTIRKDLIEAADARESAIKGGQIFGGLR